VPDPSKKIGVSMAGGAARGLAHIGTLDYFKEHDYKIAALSGSSMGAIIAGLTSLGKTSDEIYDISKTFKFISLLKPTWPKYAFSKIDKFKDYIYNLFGDYRFEDTCIPLRVVSTDIDSGEEIIFSSGPLWKGILASAAIPVIFEPFLHEGRRLSDGGLVRLNPTTLLKEFGLDAIVGSDIGMVRENTGPVKNIFDNAKQCIEILVSGQQKENEAHCDVMLRPDIKTQPFLNFSKGKTYRQLGYQACVAEAEALASLYR
jgi:NTE family protein